MIASVSYKPKDYVRITFPKLDKPITIIECTDLSFASNIEYASQLEYILFHKDYHKHILPLLFQLYKTGRIIWLALSAEFIAFSDVRDAAITERNGREALLSERLPFRFLNRK